MTIQATGKVFRPDLAHGLPVAAVIGGSQPTEEAMRQGNTAEISVVDEIVRGTPIPGDKSEHQVAPDDRCGIGAASNSSGEKVANAVRRIIEERKRPVKCAELCEQVTMRGCSIDGNDPETVLSRILWRSGDAAGIVRLMRGDGYWLKERPWEPSGYDPADEKLAMVRRALAQNFE